MLEAQRPRSMGFLLVGVIVLAMLTALFGPFFRCTRCWEKREELTSWLGLSYMQKYREEHPKEAAEVKTELSRMDVRCGRFRGRMNLVQRSDLWWFQSQR